MSSARIPGVPLSDGPTSAVEVSLDVIHRDARTVACLNARSHNPERGLSVATVFLDAYGCELLAAALTATATELRLSKKHGF